MKLLIVFIVAIIPAFLQVYTQNAWNIGYINNAEISSKLEGKTFKLDFYPQKGRKSASKSSYRFNLSRKDTTTVCIAGEKVLFVECRKIYSDWGIYKDQYLQSVSPHSSGMVLRIHQSILQEVNNRFCTFETELGFYTAGLGPEEAIPKRVQSTVFTLKKRKIQGFMFKK